MDMPQLSRIALHARVSAVSRSDEAHGDVPREFAALLVGEEAARRRHRSDADHAEHVHATCAAATQTEPDEPLFAAETGEDAAANFPEDAHDPQELRALLSLRSDEA